MPVLEALEVCVQIAAAIDAAHEQGIVHRDLKPDNIMLAEDEIGAEFVKVLDFGIAKIITEDGSVTWDELTSPNEVFGTPEYMSPEQVSGEKLDHRTDIYSLGVILYRMLTGSLPFEAETPMIMMSNHLREPPRPFFLVNAKLWLPPRLEELVMAMLAKDPDDRPESMRAVVEEIVEILKSGSKGFAGWTPSCGISIDGNITRTPYPAHSPYEAAFQAGFEAGYKANSSSSDSQSEPSPTLPDVNMDSEPIVSDSGLFAAIEGREPTGGHQF
jgi:serine/threonine-protein kinase